MFASRLCHGVARTFFPYGAVRTILAGPLRGMRFRVAPGMGVSYALGRDHETGLRFLSSRLVAGQVVYDVGANQGQFSLLFDRAAGAQFVVALEPVQANAEALADNLALNQVMGVQVKKVAAGRREGWPSFVYSASSGTMGGFSKLPAETPSMEVDAIRPDDLLALGEAPPALIKIDVEGAAEDVIEGAATILREHQPALFIELHLSPEQNFEHDAVSRLVAGHGYHVQMLDGLPLDAPACRGGIPRLV